MSALLVIFVVAIKDKLFSLQMLDEPYCSVKADSNVCIYMCHSRSGGLRPPQQATIRITIRLGAECVHSMIIQSDGERNLIGRRTQKRGVHLSQVHRLLLLVALKSYLYCLDTRLIWSDFVRKKGVLIPLTRI